MEISQFLWVFGYGSLVWKPGFEHGNLEIGYIEGFARRFWQGNENHRGIPGKPGRVATLIEEKGEVTYGVAMELTGEEALDYLNNREMKLGGYEQRITMFHAINSTKPPIPVLVYIANENSTSWLGPAKPEEIAMQVINSSGPSGHNVEYVMRLAMWVHHTLPNVMDEHLFEIEENLLSQIEWKGMVLEDFMEIGKDYKSEYRNKTEHGRTTNVLKEIMREYSDKFERKCLKCAKL